MAPKRTETGPFIAFSEQDAAYIRQEWEATLPLLTELLNSGNNQPRVRTLTISKLSVRPARIQQKTFEQRGQPKDYDIQFGVGFEDASALTGLRSVADLVRGVGQKWGQGADLEGTLFPSGLWKSPKAVSQQVALRAKERRATLASGNAAGNVTGGTMVGGEELEGGAGPSLQNRQGGGEKARRKLVGSSDDSAEGKGAQASGGSGETLAGNGRRSKRRGGGDVGGTGCSSQAGARPKAINNTPKRRRLDASAPEEIHTAGTPGEGAGAPRDPPPPGRVPPDKVPTANGTRNGVVKLKKPTEVLEIRRRPKRFPPSSANTEGPPEPPLELASSLLLSQARWGPFSATTEGANVQDAGVPSADVTAEATGGSARVSEAPGNAERRKSDGGPVGNTGADASMETGAGGQRGRTGGKTGEGAHDGFDKEAEHVNGGAVPMKGREIAQQINGGSRPGLGGLGSSSAAVSKGINERYVRTKGGQMIAQRLSYRHDRPALAEAAIESGGVFTPGGSSERQASVNAPRDQANSLEGGDAEALERELYLRRGERKRKLNFSSEDEFVWPTLKKRKLTRANDLWDAQGPEETAEPEAGPQPASNAAPKPAPEPSSEPAPDPVPNTVSGLLPGPAADVAAGSALDPEFKPAVPSRPASEVETPSKSAPEPESKMAPKRASGAAGHQTTGQEGTGPVAVSFQEGEDAPQNLEGSTSKNTAANVTGEAEASPAGGVPEQALREERVGSLDPSKSPRNEEPTKASGGTSVGKRQRRKECVPKGRGPMRHVAGREEEEGGTAGLAAELANAKSLEGGHQAQSGREAEKGEAATSLRQRLGRMTRAATRADRPRPSSATQKVAPRHANVIVLDTSEDEEPTPIAPTPKSPRTNPEFPVSQPGDAASLADTVERPVQTPPAEEKSSLDREAEPANPGSAAATSPTFTSRDRSPPKTPEQSEQTQPKPLRTPEPSEERPVPPGSPGSEDVAGCHVAVGHVAQNVGAPDVLQEAVLLLAGDKDEGDRPRIALVGEQAPGAILASNENKDAALAEELGDMQGLTGDMGAAARRLFGDSEGLAGGRLEVTSPRSVEPPEAPHRGRPNTGREASAEDRSGRASRDASEIAADVVGRPVPSALSGEATPPVCFREEPGFVAGLEESPRNGAGPQVEKKGSEAQQEDNGKKKEQDVNVESAEREKVSKGAHVAAGDWSGAGSASLRALAEILAEVEEARGFAGVAEGRLAERAVEQLAGVFADAKDLRVFAKGLSDELQEREGELVAARSACEELERARELEGARLRKELEEGEQAREALGADIGALSAEVEAKTGQLAKYAEKETDWEDEAAKLERRAEELEREVIPLAYENGRAAKEMAELERSLTEARAQLEQREKDVGRLERELSREKDRAAAEAEARQLEAEKTAAEQREELQAEVTSAQALLEERTEALARSQRAAVQLERERDAALERGDRTEARATRAEEQLTEERALAQKRMGPVYDKLDELTPFREVIRGRFDNSLFDLSDLRNDCDLLVASIEKENDAARVKAKGARNGLAGPPRGSKSEGPAGADDVSRNRGQAPGLVAAPEGAADSAAAWAQTEAPVADGPNGRGADVIERGRDVARREEKVLEDEARLLALLESVENERVSVKKENERLARRMEDVERAIELQTKFEKKYWNLVGDRR